MAKVIIRTINDKYIEIEGAKKEFVSPGDIFIGGTAYGSYHEQVKEVLTELPSGNSVSKSLPIGNKLIKEYANAYFFLRMLSDKRKIKFICKPEWEGALEKIYSSEMHPQYSYSEEIFEFYSEGDLVKFRSGAVLGTSEYYGTWMSLEDIIRTKFPHEGEVLYTTKWCKAQNRQSLKNFARENHYDFREFVEGHERDLKVLGLFEWALAYAQKLYS